MIDYPVVVGSLGVGLLLLAFVLNIFHVISKKSKTYLILNLFGGAIGCYASFLIGFMPFVVLNAIWTLVALYGLIRPRLRLQL